MIGVLEIHWYKDRIGLMRLGCAIVAISPERGMSIGLGKMISATSIGVEERKAPRL